jgi:shikimate kinase
MADEYSLLEALVRKRLVKTQHVVKALGGAVVICESSRSAVALQLLVVQCRECTGGQ